MFSGRARLRAAGLVLIAATVGVPARGLGADAGTPLGAFPDQPAGVPWPTEDWSEAPWPQGVDRAVVEAAAETAFNDGAAERVRALVIVVQLGTVGGSLPLNLTEAILDAFAGVAD